MQKERSTIVQYKVSIVCIYSGFENKLFPIKPKISVRLTWNKKNRWCETLRNIVNFFRCSASHRSPAIWKNKQKINKLFVSVSPSNKEAKTKGLGKKLFRALPKGLETWKLVETLRTDQSVGQSWHFGKIIKQVWKDRNLKMQENCLENETRLLMLL